MKCWEKREMMFTDRGILTRYNLKIGYMLLIRKQDCDIEELFPFVWLNCFVNTFYFLAFLNTAHLVQFFCNARCVFIFCVCMCVCLFVMFHIVLTFKHIRGWENKWKRIAVNNLSVGRSAKLLLFLFFSCNRILFY